MRGPKKKSEISALPPYWVTFIPIIPLIIVSLIKSNNVQNFCIQIGYNSKFKLFTVYYLSTFFSLVLLHKNVPRTQWLPFIMDTF